MPSNRRYCPRVRRIVRFTMAVSREPGAPVCLGYDPDRCSGPCPLVEGVDALEMGHRFAALPVAQHRLLDTTAWCDECQATSRMQLVSVSHLFCAGCGKLLERHG